MVNLSTADEWGPAPATTPGSVGSASLKDVPRIQRRCSKAEGQQLRKTRHEQARLVCSSGWLEGPSPRRVTPAPDSPGRTGPSLVRCRQEVL